MVLNAMAKEKMVGSVNTRQITRVANVITTDNLKTII
tara:strand:- start:207 stop:317 length:111 start_codon:yes stop_codon:yes gene_type:complete